MEAMIKRGVTKQEKIKIWMEIYSEQNVQFYYHPRMNEINNKPAVVLVAGCHTSDLR